MDAINWGAFDALAKRGETDLFARELQKVIPRAAEFTRLSGEDASRGPELPADGSRLVGGSDPMVELFKRIAKFGEGDYPVLILGERGTGKELVAAELHAKSPRRDGPFLAVNCATLTETLADSQLFGYEKGAFTGADRQTRGLIESADGGTLFLDEVGQLSLPNQAKLLRALQERKVRRLGGHEDIPVNFRLISATNRDLRKAVRAGGFLPDLYDRLNVGSVRLPALRERKGDLPKLLDVFVARVAAREAARRPDITPETLKRFESHRWPGNVRELQNVIERALALCRGGPVLLPEHVEFDPEDEEDEPTPARSREEAIAALRKAVEWAWGTRLEKLSDSLHELLDRELFQFATDQCEGNQSQMAEKLGLRWNTVSARLKDYGLK
jgi:DNA-binding NtrC family response regulator